MDEVWQDIVGWEGIYQVSNHGRIKCLAREIVRERPYRSVLRVPERIKELADNGNGYRFVHLKRDGIRVKVFVHRLVAKHFIPNSEGKPIVDHKDTNRSNNHVTNLMWVTDSENLKLAYSRGNRQVSAPSTEPEMAF